VRISQPDTSPNKVYYHEGHLKWSYRKPTRKEVCTDGKEVLVVDHDLEQVSAYRIEKGFDLVHIMQRAEPYKPGIYVTTYNGRQYTIALDKTGKLQSVAYYDDLDNKVQILFSKMHYGKVYLPKGQMQCMRVKTYKDRFINTEIDNREKQKRIGELEYELQRYQMDNAQQAQLLKQFDETKERLSETHEVLLKTQKELAWTQSSLAQTEGKLEQTQQMYTSLQDEHTVLKEHLDALQDENNKLRVNNARLLMKLETGERLSAHMEQRRRTGLSGEDESGD